jgi:hypothetical protein
LKGHFLGIDFSIIFKMQMINFERLNLNIIK